jgi:hypothetical protein
LPPTRDIAQHRRHVGKVPQGDSCTAINNIFTRSTHPPAQAEFFGQAINQLLVPFTCEEGDDLGAPIDEFRPAPPAAILSKPMRIAAVPIAVCHPILGDRSLTCERGREQSSKTSLQVRSVRSAIGPQTNPAMSVGCFSRRCVPSAQCREDRPLVRRRLDDDGAGHA